MCCRLKDPPVTESSVFPLVQQMVSVLMSSMNKFSLRLTPPIIYTLVHRFPSLSDPTPPKLRPVTNQIISLLMKYPGCRVARLGFLDLFARFYGQTLRPKVWGYHSVDTLLSDLPDVEVRFVISLFL